jgi:hypothetical protein
MHELDEYRNDQIGHVEWVECQHDLLLAGQGSQQLWDDLCQRLGDSALDIHDRDTTGGVQQELAFELADGPRAKPDAELGDE